MLHIGTFSKTINPSLRVGFMVVPPALADQMANVAEACASAPTPAIQFAIAEFMRDGHYLRHLRRMKRLYVERRRALTACLRGMGLPHAEAGLAVLLHLPDGLDDARVAKRARDAGLAPSALSWWRADPQSGAGGLLLGITNLPEDRLDTACRQLSAILHQCETDDALLLLPSGHA